MNKQLQIVLLCLLFALKIPAQNPDKYQLLWEISGKDLVEPSYLFGTMHVKDSRAFNFIDSVPVCIDKCQAFAMELDPDSLLSITMQYLSMEIEKGFGGAEEFGESEKPLIQNLLTDEEYLALNNRVFSETGLGLDQFEGKSPQALTRLLGEGFTSEAQEKTFVDAHLFDLAQRHGKKVLGLERVEDQIDVLEDMDDEWTRDELLVLLNRGSDAIKFDEMIQLYSTGDIQTMYSLIRLDPSFDQLFLYRNINMARKIEEVAKRQSTFIAVGAGHLPGKEGLIRLLEEAGFTLRPVTPQWKKKRYKFKSKEVEIGWKNYGPAENGFSVAFPTVAAPMPVAETGMTIHFSMDLGKGRFFALFDFPLPLKPSAITPAMKEVMYSGMYQSFLSQDKSYVGKFKEIEYRGLEGREFEIESERKLSLRGRIFLRGSVLFILMVGDDGKKEGKKPTKQFFESFRMFDPMAPEWKQQVSKSGAFEVEMPGNVSVKKIIQTNPRLEGKKLRSVDHSTNRTYYVEYYDYESISDFSEDTVLLLDIVKGIYGDEYDTDLDYEFTLVDGNTAVKTKFTFLEDSSIVENLAVLRGTRIVVATFISSEDENAIADRDRFFASFKLRPYNEIKWTSFSDPAGKFELDFPAAKIQIKREKTDWEEDFAEFEVFSKSDRFSAFCDQTGAHYLFERLEFDHFYWAKDTAKWLDDIAKRHIDFNDSIVSKSEFRLQGHAGFEIHFRSNQNGNYKVLRIFPAGSAAYAQSVSLGAEEYKTKSYSRFFTSLDCRFESVHRNVFVKKDQELIWGLRDTNHLIQKHALAATRMSDFDHSSDSLLLDFLQRPDILDTAHSNDAREAVIVAISNRKDDISIKQLSDFFQTTTESRFKFAVLDGLVMMKSAAGNKAMLQLLKSSGTDLGKTEEKFWLKMYIRDEVSTWKEEFPEVLDLLTNPGFADIALIITEELVQNELIDLANLKANSSKIEAFCNGMLKAKPEDLRSVKEQDVNLTRALHLLRKSDPYAYSRIITAALKHQDELIAGTAFKLNLDSGWTRDLDHDEVLNLLSMQGVRSKVFQFVVEAGNIKEFTSPFLHPDSIFYSHSLDLFWDNYHTDYQFIKLEYTVHPESNPSETYLVFSYMYDWYEAHVDILYGMSGPFTVDGAGIPDLSQAIFVAETEFGPERTLKKQTELLFKSLQNQLLMPTLDAPTDIEFTEDFEED